MNRVTCEHLKGELVMSLHHLRLVRFASSAGDLIDLLHHIGLLYHIQLRSHIDLLYHIDLLDHVMMLFSLPVYALRLRTCFSVPYLRSSYPCHVFSPQLANVHMSHLLWCALWCEPLGSSTRLLMRAYFVDKRCHEGQISGIPV
eukprot:3905783-Amphidinium_carterae.1